MSGRFHTVSFDFDKEYSKDDLLTMAIDAAKLQFIICAQIVAKQHNGMMSAEATIKTAEAVMESTAIDMKTQVWDKAAKESERAGL